MAQGNGAGRLDRIERALELLIDDHVQFREEHKQLLTAQVVLTDRLDRFIQSTTDFAETNRIIDNPALKVDRNAEDLNALIRKVEDLTGPR